MLFIKAFNKEASVKSLLEKSLKIRLNVITEERTNWASPSAFRSNSDRSKEARKNKRVKQCKQEEDCEQGIGKGVKIMTRTWL